MGGRRKLKGYRAKTVISQEEDGAVGRGSGLTPFNTSSRWSRNCMNKLIFQLVLQLTELTCGGQQGGWWHSWQSQLSTVDSAEDQGGQGRKGKPSQLLLLLAQGAPAAKVWPEPCGSHTVEWR